MLEFCLVFSATCSFLIMPPAQKCNHSSLVTGVSPYADEVGYQRPDWKRRVAATTPSGRFPKDGPQEEPVEFAFTFPAPLVLPRDDLAYDPSHPPQSLRSWSNLKERNRPTYHRRTVYVARPPSVSGELSGISDWIQPAGESGEKMAKNGVVPRAARPPQLEDVLPYLRAFYHGLEVKEYTPTLHFLPWETKKSSSSSSRKKPTHPSFIGLKEGAANSYTRIRIRPSPDGQFVYQLSLNDLLDAAIRILPRDAYALLLLVDHDLYEDDDDDFCCGRAYGGSRVAVVSSARYSPRLYGPEGLGFASIDLQHMWPASHCAANVAVAVADEGVRPSGLATPGRDSGASPLYRAVEAFGSAPCPTGAGGSSYLYGVWLFCVARTAAHELGHCFGLDHCVYYACMMQGTASVAEDYRQPPYVCPVCAKKLTRAVEEASGHRASEDTYPREHLEALMGFCSKWKHVDVWAAFEAWLEARLDPQTHVLAESSCCAETTQ